MSSQHQIAFQDPRELLYNLDELVRSMPSGDELSIASPENLEWIGRARALIGAWEPARKLEFIHTTENIYLLTRDAHASRLNSHSCIAQMLGTIQEARSTLRIIYGLRASQSFDKGHPYDFYNELRKMIETAQTDIFFVDRYMGPDFVDRYLPSVRAGVSIRLLTRDMIPQLVASVNAFVQQHNSKIEIRASQSIHGRFLSIDVGAQCFLVDASFKDAGANAPVALIELTDTKASSHAQYDGIWQSATAIC